MYIIMITYTVSAIITVYNPMSYKLVSNTRLNLKA